MFVKKKRKKYQSPILKKHKQKKQYIITVEFPSKMEAKDLVNYEEKLI